MFFKKLFGNNIEASCEYCHNAVFKENDVIICSVNREIKDGKCMRFKYNPLLRTPKILPNLPKYDPKDFEL